MSLLILILALTALTALSWAGATLYDYVVNDGYGHPRAHPLPRSHHPDAFDTGADRPAA
ncbi:hypothetical protein [Nocardioides terrisoli]|uniref:hypothetical protein n=1 Tax=Nocardioides terrisoli TaxID=3388267 RepID=UPI00287B91E9|nr:hypothetical protein [Nocardioides marmorisolisilvae]